MNSFYRFLLSISIVVTVLCFSFSPPMKIATANSDIGNAKKVFTKGIANTENKNYEQAVENFTKAIEFNSNFASAYSNRCLVYLQWGKYEAAIADCTEAIKINPENIEANLNLGLAYYEIGNYQQAIAEYTQVLNHNHNDFRALYNRGLANFELNNYQEAIGDYNLILANTQQDATFNQADIYNERGLAYLMSKNMHKAKSDFSYAIYMDAGNSRAYYNRGCVCSKMGNIEGAMADFSKTLKLNPHEAQAYLNRGLLRQESGLYQAAIQDLQAAAKCFCDRGNMSAYHHTQALINGLQKWLLSSNQTAIG
ncbi:tetratricopeptide repeat protein [Dapis sp. BLCC M229]